jgi:hypothetical protein
MLQDDDDIIIYKSLVNSLSILGPHNAELIVRTLKEQGVIRNGSVNLSKLEASLAKIFGEGCQVLLVGILPSA